MPGFLIACLLAVVGVVCAADLQATGDARAKPKPVTSFGYLDANKDARISKEEAKADWAVNQRFAEADRNRDGYLDASEFKRLTQG